MTSCENKADRIGNMFLKGYSLDLISEWGLREGWTREEAKAVVLARRWALDWSGRLQNGFLGAEAREAHIPRGRQGIGDADVEKMLSVGLDHELRDIKCIAVKAQRAIDDLRHALVLQEEKDAEEVARCRRAARERREAQADPARWEHGTWGGYLRHTQYDVLVCDPCRQAADAYRWRASGRAVAAHHERAQEAVRAS